MTRALLLVVYITSLSYETTHRKVARKPGLIYMVHPTHKGKVTV